MFICIHKVLFFLNLEMEDIFDQLLEGDANKSGDENPDEEDNENKDTGDDKEKKRVAKVERRVFNKRPTLDVMRLTGPRGIGTIENMAKDIPLKGKGHEKEDLARIMTFLHYWTHRLYPKMTFEDCIEKIENLGKKRPIQTYLTKMRLGMIEVSDDTTAA
uniref:TIMELESS-interacting protein n=1 Tax=Triatoma infestans TaxID=30076 RepID=A0A170YW34_TRIIF